jgi:hypothetical protein
MAFQAGTQIRPELGNADYSGFARAAEIQGQAFANLGAQIGGAIKDYNEKKEKKKLTKQGAELLAGLPGAEGIGITDVETAMVAIDSMGGIDNALRALNAYQSGQASTAATRQATEQSASLFPTQKELQEQNLLRQKQIFEQDAEAFPLQQKVTQAQLEGMTAGEQRAAAAEDRAQKLFPFQLESAAVKVRGQEQAIAKSIADVNAQDTKLQMEQDKLDSVVKQQEIDQANAANQKRMLDSVTGGSMSNLEYIQAGGDMNALANAEKLTGGQSFATNQKMIQSIEEEFSYLTYDYETNTWTDTRGRNRSGLPWQQFPELMNFLGTRESQALSNEGFTLGNTFN